MMNKDFSIARALSFGFSTLFSNGVLLLSLQLARALFWVVGFTVFFVLVYGFIPLYTALTQSFLSYDHVMTYSLWSCFDVARFIPMTGASIFLALIDTVFTLGLINVGLALHDKKRASCADFFAAWPQVGVAVMVNILYKLIIGLGLALFIIPGIIWALQYSFVYLILVDLKTGPLEAFLMSSQLTRGVKMQLLAFWLVILLINSAGYLFFGLGLLFTMPATVLAQVFVYRSLQGNNRTP